MSTQRYLLNGARFLVGISIICFVLAASAPAQKAPTNPIDEKQFQILIDSVKGPDLFSAYCSSCHGWDGKGGGPMASALKAKVPDLTVLAKNNKGRFPTERVRKVILGDEVTASHGTREMPVWGPIFHQIERDRDFGNVRVHNLILFLQQIQRK